MKSSKYVRIEINVDPQGLLVHRCNSTVLITLQFYLTNRNSMEYLQAAHMTVWIQWIRPLSKITRINTLITCAVQVTIKLQFGIDV